MVPGCHRLELFVALGKGADAVVALPAGEIQAHGGNDVSTRVAGGDVLVEAGWIDGGLVRVDITDEIGGVAPGSFNNA